MAGDTIFVSSPFTGTSGHVRELVRGTLSSAGHRLLEKYGGIEEASGVLIEQSDGFLYILGATAPAITDVWGRTLVELELDFARQRHKPVVGVLLGVADELALPDGIRKMRANLRQQLGDRVIEIPEWIDFDPGAPRSTHTPLHELQAAVPAMLRALDVVAREWRSLAGEVVSNKVFISYAHRDAALAERIHGALEDSEFVVWRDVERMYGGQRIESAIRSGIESSGTVIVLLSENSVSSDWVRWELGVALGRGDGVEGADEELTSFVLPVRLDDIDIDGLTGPFAALRHRLQLDLRGERFDEGKGALLAALRQRGRPDPYAQP